MDHSAHLLALSPSSGRIGARLGGHRSRCAGRVISPMPAAARDRRRGVPPLPASSSTAHALTSRPAGEQQTPPSLRNAAASESPRSDRGEGDSDKRSARRRRDSGQYAPGSSGTGKTHLALGLGLAACQKGLSVGFTTAAALVHELIEARDEKRLLRLQRQLAGYKLLIIDELGYVPLSQTGAELLFEVFSQRYERGSTLVTSNLPFDEWTNVFASERLTGALLDRLTHHVHILEMNGESYRLKQSKQRQHIATAETADNQADTGSLTGSL